MDNEVLLNEVTEESTEELVVETESMESTDTTEVVTEEVVEETVVTESVDESVEDVVEEAVIIEESAEDTSNEDEEESDESEEDEEDEEESEEDFTANEVKYSISYADKNHAFARSLSSTIEGLHKLVNEQYADETSYYTVDVYDGDKDVDKYVVMINLYTGEAYRQYYKVKNGIYSLSGDRVEVHCRYLTADEEARLDAMAKKYSEIESELMKYQNAELHSKRLDVLNNEEYSVLSSNEEFTTLRAEMDNYSVEDLSVKADLIYAKHMKKNAQQFSSFVTLGSRKETKKKDLPYGGIFENFNR